MQINPPSAGWCGQVHWRAWEASRVHITCHTLTHCRAIARQWCAQHAASPSKQPHISKLQGITGASMPLSSSTGAWRTREQSMGAHLQRRLAVGHTLAQLVDPVHKPAAPSGAQPTLSAMHQCQAPTSSPPRCSAALTTCLLNARRHACRATCCCGSPPSWCPGLGALDITARGQRSASAAAQRWEAAGFARTWTRA